MDDEVIVVRGDVEEPDAVLTGDDRRPFPPAVRMSGRHGELEVGMVGVVDDVQHVTRRLDAVLDTLRPRRHEQGSGGGRTDVDEVHFARCLARAVDDEPAVVARSSGGQPVPVSYTHLTLPTILRV